MSVKLKLTGFQRMCIEHALGVDYEYEEYEDRGDLTAEQCANAHSWIHGKLMIPWERGRAEGDWKRITITIPTDMIEAVWYVLDNAVSQSRSTLRASIFFSIKYFVLSTMASANPSGTPWSSPYM